ncbi:MAG: hypothetical protein HY270_05985 [Deltaproteobacteria bacterium]|nr:hypothetical protein [Deltaproteobacteria bacterium]
MSQDDQQGRICFVIMPFSKSASGTEEEWTQVFEQLIKPAVEAASYNCRRSAATRGSLIKGIIQDLDASWVVLADLTDRNPNVFYELGVRHALKDRTILVAQNRDDIPFDLQSYANHVYDWRTDIGRQQFTDRIKTLLGDVDRDPERADNPVSDFLENPVKRTPSATFGARLDDIESRLESFEGGLQLLLRHGSIASETAATRSTLANASPLEEGEPGASWYEAGREIAGAKDIPALRRVVRQTVQDIPSKVSPKVQELNSARSFGSIQRTQIPNEALWFEGEFAPLTRNLEQLALGLMSVDWVAGARGVLEIAGSLISCSESLSGLKFASGLPAFFGWRLLLISGARSMQEEAFEVTGALINSPIPVAGSGGQRTHRSLVRHRDLFHPEALLGYADLAIKQVGSLGDRSPDLLTIFGSSDEYVSSLIEFLTLIALRDVDIGVEERPLYPGYRLLPGFRNATGHLVSRLVSDPDRLEAVARIFERNGGDFRSAWPELASKANSAGLGSEYWNDSRIPTTLDPDE